MVTTTFLPGNLASLGWSLVVQSDDAELHPPRGRPGWSKPSARVRPASRASRSPPCSHRFFLTGSQSHTLRLSSPMRFMMHRTPLATALLLVILGSVVAHAAPCGNGVIDTGEECDDGNTQDGDCCSALCQFEAGGSPCARRSPGFHWPWSVMAWAQTNRIRAVGGYAASGRTRDVAAGSLAHPSYRQHAAVRRTAARLPGAVAARRTSPGTQRSWAAMPDRS